jgi:hypothetical protein
MLIIKINLLRDSVLTVSFDEGNLKGMTIEFIGEDLFYETVGDILALYSDSGKIITPIERKLTAKEYKYTKTAILSYAKTCAKLEKQPKKITFIEI